MRGAVARWMQNLAAMRAITTLSLAFVLLLLTPGAAAAETPDDELHFAWLPRKAEPAPPPAQVEVAAPAPEPAPEPAVERASVCAPAPKPSLADTPKRRQKAWYTRAWTAVVSVIR